MRRMLGFIMFWIAVGMIIVLFFHNMLLVVAIIVALLVLGYNLFCY